jgi:alpha-galactosidase
VLETPHSFVGSVAGGPTAVSAALRGFLTTGVRLGRPIVPLVTYNTWYPYATRIDEPTMLDEIDRTAALGMELFVLDAGWYPGAGTLGYADFDTGLGTWAVDPRRFPSGLRALTESAHAHGIKFGLWVEPGRVSLDTVGKEGLAREEWLAQRDGVNVTPASGQLCYGSRAARDWVRQKLFALLDDVQPDYLKWDNNAWINCNRAGHDHGAGDGNFSQVRGLYDILESLRERYPNLLIENVADGGSRIDFGILRYSDVAWMDDRTSPPVHVRHNLEGLSELFPPGYLLSFVLDDTNSPLAGSSDPIAAIRSSMFGVLGFAYRSPGLRSWLSDLFAQATVDYRGFRDILQDSDAILLGDQAPSTDGSGWDAIEALNASTDEAVLFAYHQPEANDRVLVRPRGLRRGATYAVRSLDAGDLGTSRGDDLMQDGIEIVQGSGTQAHILVLRLIR